MNVIRHIYTEHFVRDEDCVLHMALCDEMVDSQDAIAVDILFEEHEIDDCIKCMNIQENKK